jgi:hypothetical protein
MTSPDSPPAGYVPHDRHSPMTAPWEPIYARRTDSALQLAVQIREPHCKARGLAHGGLITALADNAMGHPALIGQQRGQVFGHRIQPKALAVALPGKALSGQIGHHQREALHQKRGQRPPAVG